MSTLSEQEIISRFRQSFSEAKVACDMLSKNANPEVVMLRGRHYKNLKTSLKEMEGCAKQMAAYRDDTRWLPLGILYGAKCARAAQKRFVDMDWLGFKKMIVIFEQGERRVTELAEKKTGRVGIILPQNPSSWLLTGDEKVPMPRGTLH